MTANYSNLEFAPRRHVIITPSDSVDLPYEMRIYCGASGNITVHDDNGVAVTYALTAGQFVPVICARVLATGTTSTQVIGIW